MMLTTCMEAVSREEVPKCHAKWSHNWNKCTGPQCNIFERQHSLTNFIYLLKAKHINRLCIHSFYCMSYSLNFDKTELCWSLWDNNLHLDQLPIFIISGRVIWHRCVAWPEMLGLHPPALTPAGILIESFRLWN